jgi:predicted metal-dependent TIM-barrel fold hydrolase
MPSVREIGANAGITVQQGKLTEEDAAGIVSSFGPDNVLVNSDLGNVPSDPLTLPKVASCMMRAGIAKGDIEKVVYKNAKELFKF